MTSYATIMPMVNQFELHPFLPQSDLRQTCAQHGIHVVAYASLGEGRLLTDATVLKVAARVGHSAAQVVLRWALQKGISVIPKSVHPERIKENAQVMEWELLLEEMCVLDAMECGTRFCWDPTVVL
eukprot:TRINITY_DN1279_c0_g1_i1.p1 TRINITY_DN1279_c0_g1~~TRINITY_DN1279_c0_g1_i1.p1  ORF type:complete len:126 (-),score=26.82 TRINITY_DN1279_c0_g1_i1:276-653(-)